MATNYQLLSSSSASGNSCDSSSDELESGKKLDFSYHDFDQDLLEINLADIANNTDSRLRVERLLLYNNLLDGIPVVLCSLSNLTALDLSNNMINSLPDAITNLTSLTHLYLRNNDIGDENLPKDLSGLVSLRDLNLSGNRLRTIPPPLIQLTGLRNLFVGGNRIESVPSAISELKKLRVLYLGGNFIRELPSEICQLHHLHALILCDNRLESLPNCICRLRRLQCLQLHQNRLTTLPHGLIFLSSLNELSLRDNPLVVRFVRDMDFEPTSLLELSARIIKIHRLPYQEFGLPRSLYNYLDSSRSCVNPQCRGVYFDTRVEHVKFVDFCGKYRIPLMQYLCSSGCRAGSPAFRNHDAELVDQTNKMRRVLLG